MIVYLLVGTTACNLNVPVIGRGFSFSCSILSPLSKHTLCKRGNGNDDNNDQTGLVTEELETPNQVETVNQIELDIQPNTWVSCVYEHNWYIGEVENDDNDDNEVEINFLERSGKYGKACKWPTRPGLNVFFNIFNVCRIHLIHS
jgi:hypothetical protein